MRSASSLAFATLLACSCLASDRPSVLIEWIEPDRFRDATLGARPLDASLDTLRLEFERTLSSMSAHRLPAGTTLHLRFTDVDLAGNYEPWRGPEWNHIRIVRTPYFPALDFDFRAIAPDGSVFRSGTASLRDLAFQTRIPTPRDDVLFYEKELLREWFRAEFPRAD